MERTKFNTDSLSSLFFQLEDVHRKRMDYMKSRIMINNQKKAIARRLTKAGCTEEQLQTHIASINANMKSFDAVETAYEKQMIKIGEQLPLHD